LDVAEQGVDHAVPDEVDLGARDPLAPEVGHGVVLGGEEEVAEVVGQYRLTSSGIARSNDRSPASTWATGMRSFEAVRAQARVELTSPATTTRSGSNSRQVASNAVSTAAVCAACEPDPTSRWTSGRGMPSSSKKTSDMLAS